MINSFCKHGGTHAALIKGTYYKDLCLNCLARLQANSPSSGHASFNRQQDLIDHEADVQQPYVGGLPNQKFIQAYPEKSRGMFSPEELRNASR